ncbi:putative sporulation protein YtxC [Halalkalibacter krulwichiae]|uniref:YtxC-like family protein n=1 Tax=Halalkalibacter krulwichiae TaxID=199441 RepID=A0A1X9MHQ1_9BACI|nr:putative sporulation protein YtxC [Halalkalibacter krulwichiae]ARK31683.1 YtxC-like family protein [Halalkalibacter krulwichiae]
MIAIHFETEQDCKQLFRQLTAYIQKYAAYGLGGAVKAEGEDTIILNYEHKHIDFYDSFHPLLASVLTDYVISTKEDLWLLDIIETMFYFTDEDEQQQILTIAKSILEGDRNDLPQMKPFFNRRAYIYDAFAKHLEEETTFYYEPFLTFRLKDYGEILIDCVEMAIDEYMLEQEYQNMIEDFRQYVQYSPANLNVVYVVHDGQFTFYDEHFRRLTREELLFYLQDDLVFEQEVDIDEMVISPLVSMVPQIVHVFTDDPDHGVVLSIQAIFQERMKLYPLKAYEQESN